MHYLYQESGIERAVDILLEDIIMNSVLSLLRGFAKLKKFQKSKTNLEVGGWVQVSFG